VSNYHLLGSTAQNNTLLSMALQQTGTVMDIMKFTSQGVSMGKTFDKDRPGNTRTL